MKKIITMKITDEEFSQACDVLSERLKNLVYVIARQRVEEKLRELGAPAAPCYSVDDEIELTFLMSFVWGDVAEIIGGTRRK